MCAGCVAATGGGMRGGDGRPELSGEWRFLRVRDLSQHIYTLSMGEAFLRHPSPSVTGVVSVTVTN